MKELLIEYYHLFDCSNGSNDCIFISACILVVVACIGVELYNRVKHNGSIFF